MRRAGAGCLRDCFPVATMKSPICRSIRLSWLDLLARVWGGVVRLSTPFAHISIDLLYVRDLNQVIRRPEARVPVTTREADERDLDMIVRTLSQDSYMYLGSSFSIPDRFSREPYAKRLERGEKCYLAFVGGELAHINWTCFTWGDAVLGYPVVLRPGEIYTTDALTLPRYRGLGIHGAVLGEMLQRAQAMGCRRAFTMSSLDHIASYKIFEGMQWRLQGCLFSVRFRLARTATILRLCGSIEPLLRKDALR
jgi:GNAT superfamily N-acetyltransferase